MVERKVGDRSIRLVRGDITDLEVEAFVFDITADLKLGSGYGGAVQQRGGLSIQKELDAIGHLDVGNAAVTSAGKLKAEHIVYVNGPKFHEEDTEGKLRRATAAALTLAAGKGIKQLAFPPVGTGLYQVPLALCARVMVETAAQHLAGDTSLDEVLFVALDEREFGPLKAEIEGGV